MEYPKEFIKGGNRKLIASGPRYLQRKQEIQQFTDQNIGALKKQIEELKHELYKDNSNKNFFSSEEIDEEIRKTVNEVLNDINLNENKVKEYEFKVLDFDNKNKKLINEVNSLKQIIDAKNELINVLKSNIVGSTINNEIENDRPKMEENFIDPLDKNAGNGLKSFLKSDEIKQVDDLYGKVDKLRKLFDNKSIRQN